LKTISAIVLLSAFFGQAFAQDDFLPGRIESRTAARTILAKCAMKLEGTKEACDGYQFYYSETGLESDAKIISTRIYTETSLNQLKNKPLVLNLFDSMFDEGSDARESGFYTVEAVQFLNDYEDSWGESTTAKIAYGAGRGVAYGFLVPLTAAMDIGGTVVAAPVTLVSVIVKGISNSKISKLIRAVKSDKKVLMNIERVYKLRDILN
jgi:hypothetical protein